MRALVLGAGGYIGKRLVSALAALPSTQVIAGMRRDNPSFINNVRPLVVDTLNAEALSAALGQADCAVNCVAGSVASIAQGAKLLFESAARCQPRPRIIHLSTMSVYGSATGIVSEDSPSLADIGWYGAAKIEAEAAARRYAADGGELVILRPGIVYGPGSPLWTSRIARMLQQGRLGDLGAAGDGHCNLVHVDDVVRAILHSLQDPRTSSGIYNLADPAAGTWNDYFVAFAHELGFTPVRRLPARRMALESRLLAPPLKILEMVAQRLGLNRTALPEPIPPSLVRLFAQDIVLDSRRAEQAMGAWTPLPDGLRQSASGYRQPQAVNRL